MILPVFLFFAATGAAQAVEEYDEAGELAQETADEEMSVSFLTNLSEESNAVAGLLSDLCHALERRDAHLYMDLFSLFFAREITDERGSPIGQLNFVNLSNAMARNGFAALSGFDVAVSTRLKSLIFHDTEAAAIVVFELLIVKKKNGAEAGQEVSDEEFHMEKEPDTRRWKIVWFR